MSVLGSLVGRVGRLTRPENPERVGVAVVLVGGVAAVVTLLVGSFVAVPGTLFGVLRLSAVLLPVIGAALVLVAASWWLNGQVRDGTTPSPLVDGDPPERGSVRSGRDENRENPIEAVASDRYRCQRDESATDVHEQLLEGATRRLLVSGGFETAAAQDAIRTGEWTDDRVAAAFLSPMASQPLVERLRGTVDPGAAYTRRVRRTLSAIEAIKAEPPATAIDAEMTAEADETATAPETGTYRSKAADREGGR